MKLESIYVVTEDRLNVYDNGVTVYLFASDGLLTTFYEGETAKTRACIDGDVLSVDPDGNLIGRPVETAGPYELAQKTSKGLLYSPSGKEGKSFLIPYTE